MALTGRFSPWGGRGGGTLPRDYAESGLPPAWLPPLEERAPESGAGLGVWGPNAKFVLELGQEILGTTSGLEASLPHRAPRARE